jgi:uncharacterized RmlC-like cupin family protein
VLKKIQVTTQNDVRGILDVANFVPNDFFVTQRIYALSKIPSNQSRGKHAHKKLKQAFFALSGSFQLKISDGVNWECVEVISQSDGYYLPNGYWRELENFTSDAICLVLASEPYDESDYIYTMSEYLTWKKQNES